MNIIINIIIYSYLLPVAIQASCLSLGFFRSSLYAQFVKTEGTYKKFKGDYGKYCNSIIFMPFINIVASILSIISLIKILFKGG